MLVTAIVFATMGVVEAQRKPMEGMDMRRMMETPKDYRFCGLEDVFLIGPLFELIGHLLFLIFSRSAMLCMRLARVFVK